MRFGHQKPSNEAPAARPGSSPPVIPYPGLENHGLIGDRRTAGLVAADGTLDWLCLPDYDGPPAFGALLDWAKGGYWRLGPAARMEGEQRYLPDTMVLETHWRLPEGSLVLRDCLLWPETNRSPEQEPVRALVRCLRCTEGKVRCRLDLQAAFNCQPPGTAFVQHSSGYSLQVGEVALRLWCSAPLRVERECLHGEFELQQGQEIWTVLDAGATGHGWSDEAASNALDQTGRYWSDWLGRLHWRGLEDQEMRRTVLLLHALSYAPEGAAVAAPTTSVPERIGGDWNADYRLAWVRDASLSMGLLARLGDREETERYLRWIVTRQARFGHPLQVLYSVRGARKPKQQKLTSAAGYRASAPVRIGNHAYKQQQFGSLGFLADCTWSYLTEGGPWQEEYWALTRRCAEYVVNHWTQPDNGIWELAEPQQFVHSKVLCWVMLDRAIKIARKVNNAYDVAAWQAERSRIHDDVMEHGWNEAVGAFSQRYGSQNLDAAELLIPILDFLPANHPRVVSTIRVIAERLCINGLVHRFDPLETPGVDQIPMGQMEGAFLPCTFWLACAYAKAGLLDKARAVMAAVDRFRAKPGLLPEALDARSGAFRGNTPLLFSHVEYARARLELAAAQARAKTEPLHKAA